MPISRNYWAPLCMLLIFIACHTQDDTNCSNLFVAIPVRIRSSNWTIIEKIQYEIRKHIDRNSRDYTPDACHITLTTIGLVENRCLPQVYKVIESYIKKLDHKKFHTLISSLNVASQEPLALYSSPFNKFFVIRLAGVDAQDFYTSLVQPLKKALIEHDIISPQYYPQKVIYSPHISIAKTKKAHFHPHATAKKLNAIAESVDLANSITPPLAMPTIILYQGLTDGTLIPLQTYTLEPLSLPTAYKQRLPTTTSN